jgi:hypothetical protein
LLKSAPRYIELTAGDAMVHKSVVQAGEWLAECQFFAGCDPSFDGDEPPDL